MGQESLRRLGGRKAKPAPPIISQEFIIQNHGDIMSCVVMLVFAGFFFQVTSPLAALFITPQYNSTIEVGQKTVWRYSSGVRDVFSVLFYTVCAVVAHAVVQEYILDKLQRRLHLSKTKTSKFTESGHLFVFSAYSIGHATHVINQEHYLPEMTSLWAGYPAQHTLMPLTLKLFFLIQLAYWFHQFPEFYFQKSKRDEIRSRTIYSVLYIIFVVGAYALNFTRVGLCILALHFISELVFHGCRMAHFAEKTGISTSGFKLFNIVFVLSRLGCVTLAVLTFWYGLRATEVPHIDLSTGNFNTTFIRVNCLLCVCGLQVYFMWNFINFHLRRMREAAASSRPKQNRQQKQQRKDKKKAEVDDDQSLPEADQETRRVLRSSAAAGKKGGKAE